MFKKISKATVFLVFCFMFLGLSATLVWAEEDGEDTTLKEQNEQEDLKNKREQERERIKAQQEKIKAEKERLAEKKEDFKEKRLAEAKKKAVQEIDRAVKKLSKTKERVSGMPTISDDLKAQLNSKIDEWITKLNARKVAVNAATTGNELKIAMETFKSDVKEAKKVIKDIVESIHKTHLQKVIAKIENFIPKVEEKVAGVSDDSKKAEATDLVNNAKTQIANAKSLTDAGKIEEARKAIKQAYRDLKNALEIVTEKEESDE